MERDNKETSWHRAEGVAPQRRRQTATEGRQAFAEQSGCWRRGAVRSDRSPEATSTLGLAELGAGGGRAMGRRATVGVYGPSWPEAPAHQPTRSAVDIAQLGTCDAVLLVVIHLYILERAELGEAVSWPVVHYVSALAAQLGGQRLDLRSVVNVENGIVAPLEPALFQHVSHAIAVRGADLPVMWLQRQVMGRAVKDLERQARERATR